MVHLRQVLMNPFFILLFFERSAAIGTERMRFESRVLQCSTSSKRAATRAAVFTHRRRQSCGVTPTRGAAPACRSSCCSRARGCSCLRSARRTLRCRRTQTAELLYRCGRWGAACCSRSACSARRVRLRPGVSAPGVPPPPQRRGGRASARVDGLYI